MEILTKSNDLNLKASVKEIIYEKGVDFEKSQLPQCFISENILVTYDNGLILKVEKLKKDTFYSVVYD